MSAISICNLFPDLLGTYGDGGNVTVLHKRLEWRSIPSEIVTVKTGDAVPTSCDIYILGGGEDQPQTSVADQLVSSRALNKAVDKGAVVLSVCAGMQIIGESFAVGAGDKGGVGLLDMKTVRHDGPRCVGELAITPDASIAAHPLTGYENHGSITVLGNDVKPLGTVRRGHGNGSNSGVDGAFSGKVLGTYMHGPVLARNAELADTLLSWATGKKLALLDDSDVEELRSERLSGKEPDHATRDLLRRVVKSALHR